MASRSPEATETPRYIPGSSAPSGFGTLARTCSMRLLESTLAFSDETTPVERAPGIGIGRHLDFLSDGDLPKRLLRQVEIDEHRIEMLQRNNSGSRRE